MAKLKLGLGVRFAIGPKWKEIAHWLGPKDPFGVYLTHKGNVYDDIGGILTIGTLMLGFAPPVQA